MPKLLVKKLDARAIAPTVAHPKEDLGYDLFALEDTLLLPGVVTKVRTGVALRVVRARFEDELTYGLLYRDRSSMASKGITVSGGVIDAGYDGECLVMLTLNAGLYFGQKAVPYQIKGVGPNGEPGDKIAQAIPTRVLTGEVEVVDVLPAAKRGAKGFGSSGR